MATTKQSTKAKTKTATRTTRRSGGRTKTATAATKPTATKKTTAKKAPARKSSAAAAKTSKTAEKTKKTIRTATKKRTTRAASVSRFKSFKLARTVTLRTLRGLHLVSAGLLVLLALAAGYFMNNTSYQLTLGHLTKDELASSAGTVLAPAVQGVYDVELRWLVVIILVLSAVLPLLYLTKLTARYAAYLNRTRMLPLRWIDLAISGALIVETTALVSGTSDLPTLKLLAGTMVVTALAGLIAERQNDNTKTPVRSSYIVALFAGLLPLLYIAAYVVSTIIYGTVQLPWYIFALLAVVLFQYVGWMRNLRMHLRGADNLIVERNYLAISLLTKAAFAIVLIAGLFR